MMADIKNGGSAFPLLQPTDPNFRRVETGMSLRDWFAGQALIGLASNPAATRIKNNEEAAAAAYLVADAMLAARLTGDQR